MTFYLKYRPQKVGELDLLSVRETLGRILKSESIPHAFLFSGPRGAGKTSAARIVAKALNCERKAGFEPCGECDQCEAITNGTSLDVIEIDAASNRGVDDMRSLREGVKLATAGAAKKVYIIDEAHMLTTEASNALLKTLEEPPSHVVFILATTVPGKLLDTIRSRTINIVFSKADEEEIVGSLEKAVKGEKLKVEEGVLLEIAKRTDGSFREAHKILEQLSFGRGKITLKGVEELFSTSSVSVYQLLSCLVKGNTKEGLEEINKNAQNGSDLKSYATQILSAFRVILLKNFGLVSQGQVPDGAWQGYSAKDFGGVDRVREAIELFSDAALAAPTCVIPQLPLELAVVKWSEGVGAGTQSNMPDLRESPDVPSPGKEEKAEGQVLRKIGASAPELPADSAGAELEEKWKIVMQEVKPKNHSIEALLRATKPKSYDGGILTLEVFYQFHKERIEKDPYRSLVEKIAEEVLGSPVKLACMLSAQKQKARDVANITEEVEEDIVKIAEEVFGASGDANDLAN